MRVVALLAAIAALWVQPARAAQFLNFSGTLTPENPTFSYSPELAGETYFFALLSERVDGLLSLDGRTTAKLYDFGKWYQPTGSCCTEDVQITKALDNTNFVASWVRIGGPGFEYIGGDDFKRTFWIERTWTLSLTDLSGPVDYQIWIHTHAVPEPSTWALMILGIGFAGAALRCRQATALAFDRPMSFLSSTV